MSKHLAYYISLFAILGLGFMLVFVSTDRTVQIASLILTAFFYVLWGLIHHFVHHDLKAKIVVEYVLMGALGIASIFLLMKGGFGF